MTELLTREEEFILGSEIQALVSLKDSGVLFSNATDIEKEIFNKGEKAIALMVSKNLGLVYSAVKSYKTHYNSNLDEEDLLQEGKVGLMNAIYKFDPLRGNKFSTVASWWIYQSINRNVNNYSRIVRLPENKIIMYGNILEIQNRYTDDTTITSAEVDEIIMDELSINSKTLNIIRKTMESPASLNKVVVNDESGSKELIDFINNTEESDLEESVVNDIVLASLKDILSDLSEKERDVLSASFALSGLSDVILKPADVRSKYSISRAKYNTILAKTLENVKKELQLLGLSFKDFI